MRFLHRAAIGGIGGYMLGGDTGSAIGGALAGGFAAGMLKRMPTRMNMAEKIYTEGTRNIRDARTALRNLDRPLAPFKSPVLDVKGGAKGLGELRGIKEKGAGKRKAYDMLNQAQHSLNQLGQNSILANKVAGYGLAVMGTAAAANMGSSRINSNRGY